MNNNLSDRYISWTWIIAVALALVLLWMLFFNNGCRPCCHDATSKTATSSTHIQEDAAPIAVEVFSFSASADHFISNGDTSNIAWFANVDALKNLLNHDLKIEGDAQTITLLGSVNSEQEKQQKGLDAQAFFGADVTINNQIIVAETASTPPPSATLYFDSGYHRLPPDGAVTLEAIVAFLQNNPDKKIIISGYHDTTGSLASNQALAKKRAKSVYDALITAGVNADSIEMRKPVSTDGGSQLNEARRVEVTIE